MTSFEGAYVGVFGHKIDGGDPIDRIEIPLIQRDYAQGRNSPDIDLIRSEFLTVLVDALSGGPPVGLDFVYGDVSHGTLRPLDGQQRLTTLFLLHWYLASRLGVLDSELPWTKFSYATRPSARLFCERIVQFAPPREVNLADWITDQFWFQHMWRHDPTIQAMLTMIGTIQGKCASLDHEAAWRRLTDRERPAIWFHVLPINEAGEGDTLYIKMNSRGRPLTRFENFKARFEHALEGSPRAKEFSTNIDGAWSDLMWPYRDVENKTDSQFERFFLFLTEVLEWRSGVVTSGRLETRAEAMFAPSNDSGGNNLDFLISALDAWSNVADIDHYFRSLFRRSSDTAHAGAIPLYDPLATVNLFKACADSYGPYVNSGQRSFGWAETLLLYAVQVHLVHKTDGIARRLRTLRNLTESSTNELRLTAMPALVTSVERFVLAESYMDALDELTTFNSSQIEDEKEKAEFLAAHADLESAMFVLEDHPILRGSLASFELSPYNFASRANAFQGLMADPSNWSLLTKALLTYGDYSRNRGNRFIRFGSGYEWRWWRELLTGATRRSLASTSAPLGSLLDDLSASGEEASDTMLKISDEWLTKQTAYDWRYYLVNYDVMRSGKSGIYAGTNGEMGYLLCMLDRTQMNNWYRDPFLSAVCKVAGAESDVAPLFFMGYETEERWTYLKASDTGLRCAWAGFQLKPPPSDADRKAFDKVTSEWGLDDEFVVAVEQSSGIDSEDRVQTGAQLLRDLLEAGL